MNRYHVSYGNFQWHLSRGGCDAPLATFDIKTEAVEFSEIYARHYRGILTVKDPDSGSEGHRDYSPSRQTPSIELAVVATR